MPSKGVTSLPRPGSCTVESQGSSSQEVTLPWACETPKFPIKSSPENAEDGLIQRENPGWQQSEAALSVPRRSRSVDRC